jgi:ATP-binding cassette subfamily F protein uup
VVGYLKDFLFSPEQARTPLRVLSGGERGRVMLARALAKPSNLLVLDEPTNDLDLETLDVLEEMLGDYSGTIIVISHDRDFLDRVATSVIAPEGDGRWAEYAGGYTDMLAQRGEALAETRGARTSASKRAAWARDNAEPEPGAAAKPATAQTPKRRLTFNETHALSTLPKRIAALERDIATLQKRLDDRDLFTREPKKFEAASSELARKAAELETAETQWLELEILRDEVAG